MSKRRLLTTCLRFTLYALGIVGAILLYAGLVADMHEPPCSRPWFGDGPEKKAWEDWRNAEAKRLERRPFGP
jgi:hypothetical protein